MIKAVLFDMDGILIDSERYYMEGTYQYMKNMGFKGTRKDVYSIIGTTMDVTYDMLFDLLDGKCSREEIIRVNEATFGDGKIPFKEIVFEGVQDTIVEMKTKGLKLALCSSSPMRTIQNCVRELDIEHYFDVIVCGDDFHESKPNPEIYLYAMEHIGVKPHEAIVYEDSALGIQAGKRSGSFTVARKELRFHLDQSAADLIVSDIFEFKEEVYRQMKGN